MFNWDRPGSGQGKAKLGSKLIAGYRSRLNEYGAAGNQGFAWAAWLPSAAPRGFSFGTHTLRPREAKETALEERARGRRLGRRTPIWAVVRVLRLRLVERTRGASSEPKDIRGGRGHELYFGGDNDAFAI